MDDNTKPTSDINENLDVPPAGDTDNPSVPPMPDDTPPPPPLTPEEVKTPSQPLPKSEERINTPISNDNEEKMVPPQPMFANNDPLPMPIPGEGVPAEAQPEIDKSAEQKEKEMVQPEKDLVKPVSEEVKEPAIETPIAPPEKEEMPVEAKFPGQPLPEEAQQNLEEKAKEMIDKDGGVKNRKVEVVGKPKGNVKKTLVGMLLFVLLGGGAFAGMKLMGNTTENRSQAGVNVPINSCATCTPWGECIDSKIRCNYPDPETGRTVYCVEPCEDSERYKCCDGTYVIWPKDKGGSDACKQHKGFDNGKGSCGSEIKVDKCTCDSWARVCGVNCKFPNGTGYEGQKKADSLCKPVIAMCNVSNGNITYEVFEPGQKCWGEQDICKNPVYQPNCKEDPKACNEACTEGECGDGMVCDTTSNTCRNPSCADSVNCVCPEGDVICNNLTCSSSSLKLGESYTFTCNASVTGSKKIETYDFRYQRNTDGWLTLANSSADSNVSSPLLISNPGNYVVECRACEEKADKTKCTPYQVTPAN